MQTGRKTCKYKEFRTCLFFFVLRDRVRENEAGLKPAADHRGAKRKVLFTMCVPAGMRAVQDVDYDIM